MTQASTYALLSANAYLDVRDDLSNQAPIPDGWTALTQFDRSGSGVNGDPALAGFSARVFQGSGGEIVISYAGTEFGHTESGMWADFLSGNVPLAVGWVSEQAYQAALLYQQVKEWAGGSGNITFTGHSLGGGLAGLMGVWFNRDAKVFAPAPFELSASSLSLAIANVRTRLAAVKPSYNDPDFIGYQSTSDFSAREARVSSYTVDGEVLSGVLVPGLRTIGVGGIVLGGPVFGPLAALLGTVSMIEGSAQKLFGSASVSELSSMNKHSIDLHAAGLLVTQFQTTALGLKDALPLLFDDRLYGYAVTGSGTEQNLLVKLIRGEVGVRNEAGQVTAAANAMLTHFSNDLGKLETAGLNTLNRTGQRAVLAQAMEWYYGQGSGYAGSEFATVSGNLLQYTSAEGDGVLAGKLGSRETGVRSCITTLLQGPIAALRRRRSWD